MFTEIVTTITTKVDITTFEASHEVDIAHDGPLPQQAVVAAALGGVRSAEKSLKTL